MESKATKHDTGFDPGDRVIWERGGGKYPPLLCEVIAVRNYRVKLRAIAPDTDRRIRITDTHRISHARSVIASNNNNLEEGKK